eukprot:531116-Hanusia_phi.AAC.1
MPLHSRKRLLSRSRPVLPAPAPAPAPATPTPHQHPPPLPTCRNDDLQDRRVSRTREGRSQLPRSDIRGEEGWTDEQKGSSLAARPASHISSYPSFSSSSSSFSPPQLRPPSMIPFLQRGIRSTGRRKGSQGYERRGWKEKRGGGE